MRFLTTCWIVLAALAGASACATGEAGVAKVRVHNPGQAIEAAVVRGTLPLPADYDKPIAALALRDGEKLLPTQVSVLSTYPGSDAKHPVGRPEVVQLAARVSLPGGAFKQLDVVQLAWAPEVAGKPAVGKSVAAWLAGKAPVLVEATDCFGNRYRAAPLAEDKLIEVRQSGPVLTEKIYQAI
ncbi:hypothetical protein LCGC14_2745040, partial [marine sediment metagenome]